MYVCTYVWMYVYMSMHVPVLRHIHTYIRTKRIAACFV